MNATIDYTTRANILAQILALPAELADAKLLRLLTVEEGLAANLRAVGMPADVAASSALAFVSGCVEHYMAHEQAA